MYIKYIKYKNIYTETSIKKDSHGMNLCSFSWPHSILVTCLLPKLAMDSHLLLACLPTSGTCQIPAWPPSETLQSPHVTQSPRALSAACLGLFFPFTICLWDPGPIQTNRRNFSRFLNQAAESTRLQQRNRRDEIRLFPQKPDSTGNGDRNPPMIGPFLNNINTSAERRWQNKRKKKKNSMNKLTPPVQIQHKNKSNAKIQNNVSSPKHKNLIATG